jgi:hypothetical protein
MRENIIDGLIAGHQAGREHTIAELREARQSRIAHNDVLSEAASALEILLGVFITQAYEEHTYEGILKTKGFPAPDVPTFGWSQRDWLTYADILPPEHTGHSIRL